MKGIIYKHHSGRTLFLSGNLLYVWYHNAWRLWQEMPWKYARIILADPGCVGGMKAQTCVTAMHCRVALWHVDYSYHQITCERVVHRIRRREYELRNGK